MNRPLDKSKKSNVKCEHCLYADRECGEGYWCSLHEKPKKYWNRCKEFKWDIRYDKEQ